MIKDAAFSFQGVGNCECVNIQQKYVFGCLFVLQVFNYESVIVTTTKQRFPEKI